MLLEAPLWKRLLREPLVHFLVSGLIIFLFFSWRGVAEDPADQRIVVGTDLQASLIKQWEQAMGRQAGAAERDRIIDGWVRDEVLYREALRLGFDKNDLVIRRRLVTKMEYLADSDADSMQPTEQQLQAWLGEHSYRFQQPAIIDFKQLWFAQEQDARNALEKLRTQTPPNWRSLGQTISLPDKLEGVSRVSVVRSFGNGFASQLSKLEADGKWHGPIESGYGHHLIAVTERSASVTPPLADIRENVEADWRNDLRERSRRETYQNSRKKYDVVVAK